MRTAILCELFFFFFKQKTAYEIGWCDWSSDVCSSDLVIGGTLPNLKSPPPPSSGGGCGSIIAIIIVVIVAIFAPELIAALAEFLFPAATGLAAVGAYAVA